MSALSKIKLGKKKEEGTTGANLNLTPALPVVNLLSSGLQEVILLRRARRTVALSGVGVLVGLVVLVAGQQGMISVAQGGVDDAAATGAKLNLDKAALAPFDSYYSQVDANRKAIQVAMSKEVMYSRTLSSLRAAQPVGVTLGNFTVTADTIGAVVLPPAAAPASSAAAPAAGGGASGAASATAPTPAAAPTAAPGSGSACPGSDPFNPVAPVGCISLVGSASSREAVGKFINNLTHDAGGQFTNVFVSTTTVGETGSISFNATVGLTDKIYSGRWASDDFIRGAAK